MRLSRVSKLVLIFAALLLIGNGAWANVTPIITDVQDQGDQQRIRIQTDLVDYLFNTRTGALESAYIHFNTFDTAPAELLPGVETNSETWDRLFAPWISFPFHLSLDEADSTPYAFTLDRQGQFSLDDNTFESVQLQMQRDQDGLEVTKRFLIPNSPYYQVFFQLVLKNTTEASLRLEDGYTLTLTAGVGAEEDPKESYLFDGQSVEQIPAQYTSFGGLGYLGKGLALFLKNETLPLDANHAVVPWVSVDDRGEKLMGLKVDTITLEPGEEITYDFLLYAGRWKYVLMEQSGLEEVAGKGIFSTFLVPMIHFLNWLFVLTGNYAWAILIFTLITRVLLFPLMRQQFHSMAKMRAIQPKMEKVRKRYPGFAELRKRHPDMDTGELQARARQNREKQQKKTMELYQREGVNPLGGCLPSLVQLPILILLWRTILYSAEAIHFSPGFLWINDLSQPDPYYLLVVITVGLMILQTRMTPQMSTGMQNQLLIFGMPVFMGFFLRNFPAGLWLYYLLTTGMQILQQGFINWEIAQKGAKASLKAEAAGKGPGDDPGDGPGDDPGDGPGDDPGDDPGDGDSAPPDEGASEDASEGEGEKRP